MFLVPACIVITNDVYREIMTFTATAITETFKSNGKDSLTKI